MFKGAGIHAGAIAGNSSTPPSSGHHSSKHINCFIHFELFFFCPQVHIQTIGILVSEKSELQTALQYTQQAARQKSGRFIHSSLKLVRFCLRENYNVQKKSPRVTVCICVWISCCSWGRGIEQPPAVDKAASIRAGTNALFCLSTTETIGEGLCWLFRHD